MNTVNNGKRVRWGWWVMAILSFLIALYGSAYLILGEQIFPPNLAESFKLHLWAIYTHIGVAVISLVIGPLQFHAGFRQKRINLHRNLGKVHIIAAALTGLTGLYLSFYALGGWVSSLGFGILGTLTMITTGLAYQRIREVDIDAHRRWMIRSYALLFAAVALRLWLPTFAIALPNFESETAYILTSWLCWVPNLIVAEWYVQRNPSAKNPLFPQKSWQ
ncbi:MAG: DUF2306 domain-containing protein [Anaerolineae bacterium]